MFIEIILFVIGSFIGFIFDTWWWTIDFKKAEKGLEAHEHYHVGMELLIIGIIVSFFSDVASFLLGGLGFAFIMAEWRQVVEIRKTENGKEKKKEVVPGHPFAQGSEHFLSSTIIGIILSAIIIILIAFYSQLQPLIIP